VVVDEPDHHLARRSSSALAKYADASRRNSFARRSSTFSALDLLQTQSLLGRQAGALTLVTLGLANPAAERLGRTSDFSAIDVIAAHCDACACP